MFIDSHCHLDFPEFQTRLPEVLANMAEAKVKNALCISVDLPDFPKVLKLAEDYPHLYASVGVHPDYEDTPEPTFEFLVETAKHPKIIAIGEKLKQGLKVKHRSTKRDQMQSEICK